MTIITIFAISMAIASAIFWCIEVMPFVRAMKALETPKAKNKVVAAIESINYIGGILKASTSLWKIAIDITVTIWLTGAFSLGGTVTGAIIGLTISNVISIFIIIIDNNRKEKERRNLTSPSI